MKRIKLLLTLLLLSTTFGIASAFTGGGSGLPFFDREVAVQDVVDPVQPERERSLLPTCSAYLSSNYLTVYVNCYIGEAQIVVTNTTTGAFYTASLNSEFEFEATIAEQLTSGSYTLTIYGSDGYVGEGSFTIE